jgi:hypothetical protein
MESSTRSTVAANVPTGCRSKGSSAAVSRSPTLIGSSAATKAIKTEGEPHRQQQSDGGQKILIVTEGRSGETDEPERHDGSQQQPQDMTVRKPAVRGPMDTWLITYVCRSPGP